jgi:hypothetical protein
LSEKVRPGSKSRRKVRDGVRSHIQRFDAEYRDHTHGTLLYDGQTRPREPENEDGWSRLCDTDLYGGVAETGYRRLPSQTT